MVTEIRPWGWFTIIYTEGDITIKRIHVNKNESTSLQYHKNRNEYWFNIDMSVIPTEPEIHRIFGIHQIIGERDLIEISTGKFDEKDIVRLADKYGRK